MSPPLTVLDELSPSSRHVNSATPGLARTQPARSAKGNARVGARGRKASRVVNGGIRKLGSGATMNDANTSASGSPSTTIEVRATKTDRPALSRSLTTWTAPSRGSWAVQLHVQFEGDRHLWVT